MAIQMRQGNEVDFDAEKMLPGEWAVSTDARIVRMCFAHGVVVRMATYEAFEADMVAIEAILKNVQDIQTAVKLVQAQIDGKSELVAENASLAEQYMIKAKEYSELAGAFTGMQIAKRDLLGVVKGGDMAVEDDGALRNFKKAKGTNVLLTDTVKAPLFIKLYGKSVQDGIPTPDNPQEIKSVVVDKAKVCGKNLLNHNTSTVGVHINVNGEVENGSVAHYASDYIAVIGGKTIHQTNMGNWGGVGNAFYDKNKNFISFISGTTVINNNSNFDVPANAVYMRVSYAMGDSDNQYPQIEYGTEATPYEPYTENTVTLSQPITLHGIPVTDASLATYTDASGQMWCADMIEEINGKMCLVKIVSAFTLNGSESWSLHPSIASYFYTDLYGSLFTDNTRNDFALTQAYRQVVFNNAKDMAHGYFGITTAGSRRRFAFRNTNYTTVDEFKAHLAENPITIICISASSYTEPIPEIDQIALRALHSYDGVTHVMCDAEIVPTMEAECATSNVAAYVLNNKREIAGVLSDLGTADISAIGDGTVKGAIKEHDSKFLPLAGGTLSGDVTISDANTTIPGMYLGNSVVGEGAGIAYFKNDKSAAVVAQSGDKYTSLYFYPNAPTLARRLQLVIDNANWYQIFGEHNKPSGSYTGNGSATSRTINTGGIGSVILIREGGKIGLFSTYGGVVFKLSGSTIKYIYTDVHFKDGVLTLATADGDINYSGAIYNYQVL